MVDMLRSLPGLKRYLDRMEDRLSGRMARVVSVSGDMVMVEVPRVTEAGALVWDGPLGPYPSSQMGPVPGTHGTVHPLRGGKRLFVPQGVLTPGQVMPFQMRRTGAQQVTAVGASGFEVYLSASIVVSVPGRYQFFAGMDGTMGKNTNSGVIYIRGRQRETDTLADGNMSSDVLSLNSRTEVATAVYGGVTVPEGGMTLWFDILFGHSGAAGTATMYRGRIHGWVQRIGAG